MIDILIVLVAVTSLGGLGYYIINKYQPLDEMMDEFGITDETERENFKKL